MVTGGGAAEQQCDEEAPSSGSVEIVLNGRHSALGNTMCTYTKYVISSVGYVRSFR